MKVLIPFLFIDNLITWNDQLFDILINVDYLNPPLLCSESHKNLIYLISTTVSSFRIIYLSHNYNLIVKTKYRQSFVRLKCMEGVNLGKKSVPTTRSYFLWIEHFIFQIRSFLCASQPVFILSYHELFRKKFLEIFCKTISKKPPKFMTRRTQPTCKMKKLSNVLGSEIKLAITQQEYFDIMKTYW